MPSITNGSVAELDAAVPPVHSPAFVITSCARFLERRLDDQLPLSRYRILAMLGDAPERAGRVSRLLELSKPAVTDTVDGLVDRGLAIRRVDDNDRRAVAATITEAGCEMFLNSSRESRRRSERAKE